MRCICNIGIFFRHIENFIHTFTFMFIYHNALRHKLLYSHNWRVSALVIKYSAVVWRYLVVIVIFLSYLYASNIRTRVCYNSFYSERKWLYFIARNLKDSHISLFVMSFIKLRKYINLFLLMILDVSSSCCWSSTTDIRNVTRNNICVFLRTWSPIKLSIQQHNHYVALWWQKNNLLI